MVILGARSALEQGRMHDDIYYDGKVDGFGIVYVIFYTYI